MKNQEKNQDKNKEKQAQEQHTFMIKPQELIPIMAQTSDPLGSYTGVPAGNPHEKPEQDADDL